MSAKKAKKTKKKSKLPPVLIALGCIIAAALLAFPYFAGVERNNQQAEDTDAAEVQVYFWDSTANSLTAETRQMTATDPVEIVKFALEELAMGPRNAAYQPSVPRDMIKSATISGKNVDVTVNEEYLTQSPVEEMTARSALVKTLTSLDFVDSITINVNGEELKRTSGQALGKIHLDDVVTKPDISPSGQTAQVVTLYFSNKEGTKLVSETRTIWMSPNESIAVGIIEEIIKGPVSNELSPTVPPDTRLIDASTLDGLCSLDFSKEFISKHTAEYPSELLTIYSIVNSLCEQSDIRNVQFMIEGERQDTFNNFQAFKSIFEARDLTEEDVKQ